MNPGIPQQIMPTTTKSGPLGLGHIPAAPGAYTAKVKTLFTVLGFVDGRARSITKFYIAATQVLTRISLLLRRAI